MSNIARKWQARLEFNKGRREFQQAFSRAQSSALRNDLLAAAARQTIDLQK